ncbi:hypothetical protein ACFL3C_02285 [Patescibacteria group bacterium]
MGRFETDREKRARIVNGRLLQAIMLTIRDLRRVKHERRNKEPIKKFAGSREKKDPLLDLLWLSGIRHAEVVKFFSFCDYGYGVAIPFQKFLAFVLINGRCGVIRWLSKEECLVVHEIKREAIQPDSTIDDFAHEAISASRTETIKLLMEEINSFNGELVNPG